MPKNLLQRFISSLAKKHAEEKTKETPNMYTDPKAILLLWLEKFGTETKCVFNEDFGARIDPAYAILTQKSHKLVLVIYKRKPIDVYYFSPLEKYGIVVPLYRLHDYITQSEHFGIFDMKMRHDRYTYH